MKKMLAFLLALALMLPAMSLAEDGWTPVGTPDSPVVVRYLCKDVDPADPDVQTMATLIEEKMAAHGQYVDLQIMEAPAGTYTYSEILAAGEDTSAHPLKLTISGLPETANEGDTLNVVVVYESTKVTYDENGDPEAPNWEMATVVVEKPEGGEQ